ncbi:MarR family transcriptional regulator [Halorubrum ezzemoulense]|jgi:DNA-binding MarR family transcriptional regulator|uniref:MarR family transcriptional regulator n=1 Tax=Halorubrum ezzemoulense TaxID=337243 RepID=UPI00211B66D5|nr:helix-turn-helix domain-containing protein [Halorubrum ezzemoulense]
MMRDKRYQERYDVNMPLRIDENTEKVIDEFVSKGNLTTGALVDFTGLSRPTVTKRLDRLHAAEFVEYVHEPTALWQLTKDPRTN